MISPKTEISGRFSRDWQTGGREGQLFVADHFQDVFYREGIECGVQFMIAVVRRRRILSPG